MYFKSDKQPYCRWCGKAIRKATDYHIVSAPFDRSDDPVLTSQQDCQRQQNAKVVYVRYSREGDYWHNRAVQEGKIKPEDRLVSDYRTWDGESYEDEFFCTNTCAIRFARSIARNTSYATESYRQASRKEESHGTERV